MKRTKNLKDLNKLIAENEFEKLKSMSKAERRAYISKTALTNVVLEGIYYEKEDHIIFKGHINPFTNKTLAITPSHKIRSKIKGNRSHVFLKIQINIGASDYTKAITAYQDKDRKKSEHRRKPQKHHDEKEINYLSGIPVQSKADYEREKNNRIKRDREAAQKRKEKREMELRRMRKECSANGITDFVDQNICLYITKDRCGCYTKKHPIICKTGVLRDIDGNKIEINVNYCKECKMHFIKYNEYESYKNHFGLIFGKMIYYDKTVHSKMDQGYYNVLSDASPLYLNGYTVNQDDDLSDARRQNCLKNIIEFGILTKPRVINYLDSFIERNGKSERNRIAVLKWKDDLGFVKTYNMDKQEKVMIKDIKKSI